MLFTNENYKDFLRLEMVEGRWFHHLGSIAFFTVSYQSAQAALVNPVESLRNE